MENIREIIGKTLVTVDVATDEIDKMVIQDIIENEHCLICENYPSKIYLYNENEWNRLLNYKMATIHPDEVECYILNK